MRWKRALVLLALIGIGFTGGTLIGQNAAKKVQESYSLEEQEEYVQGENVSVLSQNSVQDTPSPKPTEKPSKYLLVLSDKEICVYELPPEGDAIFIYEAKVEIDQLRQEDYQRLCRGIKVGSLEEARALTEDFGS
ncbi:MAG: hypothetical protein IJN74_08150 [Clostridia bacterium]|nr:hypothetical protein [Clostridia bacterium]